MRSLLRIRGFLPYVLMLFFNAFVDLGHKIIMQNTIFKVYEGHTQIILTAIVNGLILLPFIMSFTPAGFCSDKYPKNRVMLISAWVAIGITLLITWFYHLGWFWPAFLMTFALALQSAFYSPAKYGYIKELVGKEKLAAANGVVQAVTIVAILSGLFVFSVLFESLLQGMLYDNEAQLLRHIAVLGWLLALFSVVEMVMACMVPKTRDTDTGKRFVWRDYWQGRYLRDNLALVLRNRNILLCIVGLAVFWSLSQVLLATFPSYAKSSLQVTNTIIIQGMLACSGIGIIIGSILAGQISRHHVETGLIPIGSVGIALCLAVMLMLGSVSAHAVNFVIWGIFGGMLIIPLNALIQFHAKKQELGRVLAGNNLIQNVCMLAFLLLTVLFAWFEMDQHGIFLILLVVAIGGGVYTVRKLPQSMLRLCVHYVVGRRYRLRVHGLDFVPESGGALLLGNHISWLDWAILQMACPRPIRFVMIRDIYERRLLRWFLDLFRCIPVSGTVSRSALRQIHESLRQGEMVCLFPEGAISRTGQLSTFRKGFEKAAEGLEDAVILPFCLHGLWGSWFSRAGVRLQRGGSLRRRDIRVTFGAPMPINSTAAQVKRQVMDLSMDNWERYSDSLPPLGDALIRSMRRGLTKTVVTDSSGERLSGLRALTSSICLARLIRRHSGGQNVGMLLPASGANAVCSMAALFAGKTVVHLNFSAGAPALRAAVRKAGIDSVYTSERFLRKLEQKGMNPADGLQGCRLLPLEQLAGEISATARLLTLLQALLLPAALLRRLHCRRRSPEDVAAILFSSGSEGDPKGVMLTHRNIMSNLKQAADVMNMEESDIMLANLPPFHAFGMTVTTFMPLVEGIPMVCHPDPTDTLHIAKAIARHRATILCGTATFLRMYVRKRQVHPLMLESLRLVIAGAEKLPAPLRDEFQLKFNKSILEGYGATETTPVASVNIPDVLDAHHWEVQSGGKPGAVGMPLPGCNFRIVDPDTLHDLPVGEDGLILIGGTQVMKGYLGDPRKTAAAIVEIDGKRWYKSGDKGRLDEDGFLTIVDRYSRFAKIGGEMISLTAVETQVREAVEAPEMDLVAVSLEDSNKGERIVLLITEERSLEEIRRAMRKRGQAALMIPSEVRQVPEIPKLGSGKTDFRAAQQAARTLAAETDGHA